MIDLLRSNLFLVRNERAGRAAILLAGCLAIVMIAAANSCDPKSISDTQSANCGEFWLYRYQSLITGLLAVSAAAWTATLIRRQIREAQKQNANIGISKLEQQSLAIKMDASGLQQVKLAIEDNKQVIIIIKTINVNINYYEVCAEKFDKRPVIDVNFLRTPMVTEQFSKKLKNKRLDIVKDVDLINKNIAFLEDIYSQLAGRNLNMAFVAITAKRLREDNLEKFNSLIEFCDAAIASIDDVCGELDQIVERQNRIAAELAADQFFIP